jgi:hypothetical protein
MARGGLIGDKDATVTITARTNTFEPAFTVGHGIVDTAIKDDGDGTWTFTIALRPVVRPSVDLPTDIRSEPGRMDDYNARVSEFLATAQATHVSVGAEAYTWPPSYLYWTKSRGLECAYVPMNGMWATTNGSGFEFGVRDRTATTGTVPYEFGFKVSAPHIITKDMLDVEMTGFGARVSGPFTGTSIVNPADIRMKVPKNYLTALGYSSSNSVPSSAIQVVAQDGQKTSPSLSAQDDGSAILDFGISHFSAPNPSVSISPPATKPQTLKRSRSLALSKVIKTTKKGQRQWKSTGKCRISGSKVVASRSKGTCKVTLVIRNSSRKITFKKTVSLKIV